MIVWYATRKKPSPDFDKITKKSLNNILGLTAQTESDRMMYRTNKRLINGDLVITSPDLEKSKKFWNDLTNQNDVV